MIGRMAGVNEFYKKGCQEKKLRLERSRDFFLEIQPTVVSGRLGSWAVVHTHGFSAAGGALSSWRERQARVVECVNHGSIRGSWPMAISGYPREHNV